MSQHFSILIIDDEQAQADAIAGYLKKKGYAVTIADSGTAGVRGFENASFDLVLTDYKMPDITGAEVLRKLKEIQPEIPVIVMTAYGSIESAVDLMKQGAFDYLQKPIDLDELTIAIQRAEERATLLSENAMLKQELRQRYSFDNIISQSDEMEAVLNTVARVAPSLASVLICGESGTGKELIARAVHHASNRSDGPFIPVNCAAIPESLFESELFGHEKGAFTGADQRRIGKFEQAKGGTLFIDEVGDIPLPVQVKLLRAIQLREIERLGGTDTISLDVRIVAATNRKLEEMIREGDFREDLYYRLNVITVQLPPLRSRKADIPPLVEHFIAKYCEENGKPALGISKEALDALLRYGFPGNIRELENSIQRAVVMTRGNTITVADLPTQLTAQSESASEKSHDLQLGDLNEKVEALERALIRKALEESSGNQSKAAELLHISERTLRYKLGKYGI
ncbi:MAG: two-component system response regulator [Ectothiorhodospiraceae bacterium]|nr:two-component system response regulator [Ectothiorhodospiraceae bacterium]